MTRSFHWEQIGPEADRGMSTSYVKVYDDVAPQQVSQADEGSGNSRYSATDVKHKIEVLLASNGQPARLTLIAQVPQGFAFVADRVLYSTLKNSGTTIETGIELAVGATRVEVSVSREEDKSAIAVIMR